MIAVDTNVLVRLVTNDDPAQASRAVRLFASEDVFVPKTVLLETEWVLRGAYGLDRALIADALERLVGTASVAVETPAAVRRALGWFRAGLDFADALHLASLAPAAERFVTLDRGLARRVRRAADAPPVEPL
jgi:predicted nucleic-acid-binding protein